MSSCQKYYKKPSKYQVTDAQMMKIFLQKVKQNSQQVPGTSNANHKIAKNVFEKVYTVETGIVFLHKQRSENENAPVADLELDHYYLYQ